MKNYFRGAASISTFFVLSIVLTIFFLYLGLGVGGAIIAIAISIFATSTFGYKSLDEQYEEDLRNPKYLYPKNNLINDVNSSSNDESYEDLVDEEEYEESFSTNIQNIDDDYEDESMKRFSDYSDEYYISIVQNKNTSEEE
tara:strand:+ start:99 stop:521 length:423 start_codon:yes stop_codon:yes gene_type:complete